MKKILIALDYEPSAEMIAETGYKIATALNAEITLLHVIAEPAYYSSLDYSPIMGYSGFMDTIDPALTDTVKDDIKKMAQEFLENSKKHLGNDSIKTIVTEGSFAHSIVDASEGGMADLIVMGSHNRRGLDKLLMENVAEKVIHLSKIPVLVIPIKDGEKNG
ncbi:universal stress protein [Ferruginibacter paludis]|uniref:universal stress protein n=1 Tax=Ferruginibacter paludis TaxID=1310417 RepID=UPI0025B2ADA4|nr:universal stress protein [Ferruginibacter paludis]MDN3654816.1 universal stress protein [Ferruginibacter paludis]